MLEPFVVAPVLVEKPWGGTRLSEMGKYPGRSMFGESWEIADLAADVAPNVEDPVSRVVEGRWRGWSLGALAARFGAEMMGPIPLTPDGRFPLLVKFIDAREHLSVQVHPHETYVDAHPEAKLKTESWYVVDADPGSSLFLDIAPGVSSERAIAELDGVSVVANLRSIDAIAGSFHHVPAGMIHALGAGVLVAEIQTPSDSTFRIYDWSGEYGREPRPLHTDAARATLVPHHSEAFDLPPIGGNGTRGLVETPYYWVREHRAEDQIRLSKAPGFRVLTCVAGKAHMAKLAMRAGSTVIVPACAIDTTVDLSGTLLEIGVPAPT